MHQLCTSAHLIYSCVEVVVSRTQLELNHGSRVTSKASVLASLVPGPTYRFRTGKLDYPARCVESMRKRRCIWALWHTAILVQPCQLSTQGGVPIRQCDCSTYSSILCDTSCHKQVRCQQATMLGLRAQSQQISHRRRRKPVFLLLGNAILSELDSVNSL